MARPIVFILVANDNMSKILFPDDDDDDDDDNNIFLR